MDFPHFTATYGAVLGLIFIIISIWVVMGRARHKVGIGDGGLPSLTLRIRSHANFAEYVPLALILIAFKELGGVQDWIIHALCLIFLLARVAHPIGMAAPDGSSLQKAFRGPAILGTWGVIIVASILLLLG